MPIDPATLIDTLQTNADYDVTGSVEKAKAFVTAARQYLSMSMTQAEGLSEHSVRLDLNVLKDQLESALKWLAASGGLPNVDSYGARKMGFEEFTT